MDRDNRKLSITIVNRYKIHMLYIYKRPSGEDDNFKGHMMLTADNLDKFSKLSWPSERDILEKHFPELKGKTLDEVLHFFDLCINNLERDKSRFSVVGVGYIGNNSMLRLTLDEFNFYNWADNITEERKLISN